MALGAWFLNNKKGNSMKNVEKSEMDFIIGDSKYCQHNTSDYHFYIAEDTSLLYNGMHGDYSVLLGGNWRFELIVDSFTGLCTHVQSFLKKLEVTYTTLELPKYESKDLYFAKEGSLEPGGGCHYFPFANKAFWDARGRTLCYGDPNSKGDAVEFTSKTIAIIDKKRLMCVYLLLDDITGEIVF